MQSLCRTAPKVTCGGRKAWHATKSASGRFARLKASRLENSVSHEEISTDLYDLFGLEEGAPLPEIKKSYREMMRRCHPDHAGQEGFELSVMLNRAYKVLSEPELRHIYDAGRLLFKGDNKFAGFTGQPISANSRPDIPTSMFVDEVACVGCRECHYAAPSTFTMEDEHGCARATNQWADDHESVMTAMESCPADCIYEVPKDSLATLEFVMASQPRPSKGIQIGVDSLSGRAKGLEESPFIAAERLMRRAKERARDARIERERQERMRWVKSKFEGFWDARGEPQTEAGDEQAVDEVFTGKRTYELPSPDDLTILE